MPHEHEKDVTYLMNDEAQVSTEKKLTMREIVEGAGFSPASDYELEENDHGHRTYVDPDGEVVLHNGQHFTVTYTGVTPTSDLG